MMNSKLKLAIAAAVLSAAPAMVFATTIVPPISGPVPATTAATGSGLVVEAWDPTLNVGVVEYLGPTYQSFSPTGSLNPVNPAGATYDFGNLTGTASSFNSLFAASKTANDTIDFAVVAATTVTAGAYSVETTGPVAGLGTVRNGTVGTAASGLLTTIGNITAGALTFTSADASNPAYAFVNEIGTKINGAFGSGVTGTAGGGAVGFYQATQTSSTGTGLATKFTYGNTTGPATFTLSSDGDLVYNVPAPAAVPLPAAVWLFGSGLLGLAGVGRRRAAARA